MIAFDIITRSHILKTTHNGRIETKPAGLVESGKPLIHKFLPIDLRSLWIQNLDEPPT